MTTEDEMNRELEEASKSVERRILRRLGYFGHFLHVHAGGRGGKQFVLVRLLHCGGQLTQRELQESVGISSAALSEVLAKLEGEGLVVRTRSEQDKRQLDIALTEAGRELACEVARKKIDFEREAFEPLDQARRLELADDLDRLMEHWKLIEQKERGAGNE